MLCLMYDYCTIYYDAYAASDLCRLVSWLAKCHTKRCFFLQNNAVGHTTYAAMADMLAGPMLLLCAYQSVRLFDCSSISSFDDFAAK